MAKKEKRLELGARFLTLSGLYLLDVMQDETLVFDEKKRKGVLTKAYQIQARLKRPAKYKMDFGDCRNEIKSAITDLRAFIVALEACGMQEAA